MQIDLDPDFAEFVECLARHDVRYLIVGGYALAARLDWQRSATSGSVNSACWRPTS